MRVKNVYAIDCDNFNNRYDMPKGHSYFLEDDNNQPGKVFKHMFETIKAERVSVDDQERHAYTWELQGKGEGAINRQADFRDM